MIDSRSFFEGDITEVSQIGPYGLLPAQMFSLRGGSLIKIFYNLLNLKG
jgi:hypothetical protein